MVGVAKAHDVRWLAPAPMWSPELFGGSPINGALTQPTILRFSNDLFMDELLALLGGEPGRLPEWIAIPETWREPMRTPAASSVGRSSSHRRNSATQ